MVYEDVDTCFILEMEDEEFNRDESRNDLASIKYFSGNPSVERTQGILHLYKDK